MRLGRAVRLGLVVGVAFVAALVGAGVATGETPAGDTLTFVDAAEGLPGCCAVPIEVVAQAAVKELPGVLRVDVDEASGDITIRFDPTRVSRAALIAALEPYSFRPTGEERGPETK